MGINTMETEDRALNAPGKCLARFGLLRNGAGVMSNAVSIFEEEHPCVSRYAEPPIE